MKYAAGVALAVLAAAGLLLVVCSGAPGRLYAQEMEEKEELIFSDNFSSNKNHWLLTEDVAIKGGKMHITGRKDYARTSSTKKEFADFTAEATFRVVKTKKENAWYGLWVRYKSPDETYSLQVNIKGEYVLRRGNVEKVKELTPLSKSKAVKKGGGKNTLKVRCKGSEITFWINGTRLGSVTDDTFKKGKIVFFADFDTYITVDDLKVYGKKEAGGGEPEETEKESEAKGIDIYTGRSADFDKDQPVFKARKKDILAEHSHKTSPPAHYTWRMKPGGDFAFSVSVKITKAYIEGHGAGIVFGRKAFDDCFSFSIDGLGHCGTFRMLSDKGLKCLKSNSFESKKKSWVKVRVEMIGKRLTTHINDSEVHSVELADYAVGKIGIFVHMCKVYFKDLTFYDLSKSQKEKQGEAGGEGKDK